MSATSFALNALRTTRREFLAGAACCLAAARASAQATDLTELSILEAAALIRSRALSPIELTSAYLERIERLNPSVNAYITVTPGLALEQARLMTNELDAGRWRGPLPRARIVPRTRRYSLCSINYRR